MSFFCCFSKRESDSNSHIKVCSIWCRHVWTVFCACIALLGAIMVYLWDFKWEKDKQAGLIIYSFFASIEVVIIFLLGIMRIIYSKSHFVKNKNHAHVSGENVLFGILIFLAMADHSSVANEQKMKFTDYPSWFFYQIFAALGVLAQSLWVGYYSDKVVVKKKEFFNFATIFLFWYNFMTLVHYIILDHHETPHPIWESVTYAGSIEYRMDCCFRFSEFAYFQTKPEQKRDSQELGELPPSIDASEPLMSQSKKKKPRLYRGSAMIGIGIVIVYNSIYITLFAFVTENRPEWIKIIGIILKIFLQIIAIIACCILLFTIGRVVDNKDEDLIRWKKVRLAVLTVTYVLYFAYMSGIFISIQQLKSLFLGAAYITNIILELFSYIFILKYFHTTSIFAPNRLLCWILSGYINYIPWFNFFDVFLEFVERQSFPKYDWSLALFEATGLAVVVTFKVHMSIMFLRLSTKGIRNLKKKCCGCCWW